MSATTLELKVWFQGQRLPKTMTVAPYMIDIEFGSLINESMKNNSGWLEFECSEDKKEKNCTAFINLHKVEAMKIYEVTRD